MDKDKSATQKAAPVGELGFYRALAVPGAFRYCEWHCCDSVCHLPVRSVTCRSMGEKSLGRINCSASTLRLHFATVRNEKHGLPPHPCSVALDFEICFRWKKYRESSIHCILISSCELDKYWILQGEKSWKTLAVYWYILQERKHICKTLCQTNCLPCYQFNSLRRNCFPW